MGFIQQIDATGPLRFKLEKNTEINLITYKRKQNLYRLPILPKNFICNQIDSDWEKNNL